MERAWAQRKGDVFEDFGRATVTRADGVETDNGLAGFGGVVGKSASRSLHWANIVDRHPVGQGEKVR